MMCNDDSPACGYIFSIWRHRWHFSSQSKISNFENIICYQQILLKKEMIFDYKLVKKTYTSLHRNATGKLNYRIYRYDDNVNAMKKNSLLKSNIYQALNPYENIHSCACELVLAASVTCSSVSLPLKMVFAVLSLFGKDYVPGKLKSTIRH